MSPKKLLFLTWPEHGQANCQLAVIAEIQRLHPDAEIHLGSNEELKKRSPKGIKYHELKFESLAHRFVHGPEGLLKHPEIRSNLEFSTSFFGVIWAIICQSYIICIATPAEYITQVKDVEDLCHKVKPDLVIVDSFYNAAREALPKTDYKAITLSPNTLKEMAVGDQELGAFSIPFVGSRLPYPVPWYYLPVNTFYLIFAGIYIFFIDWRIRRMDKARHEAGYEGPLPLIGGQSIGQILCMDIPELDYPMKQPKQITCCGPILQSPISISSSDAELASWLDKRPTILILLGSHIRLDQAGADQLFQALSKVLDKRNDIQVLWKLMPLGKVSIPEAERYGDRVRIVSWINPNPIDILRTGNIITMVNHGGSNSYHEALGTGTPQVILSPWFDCHDFGGKVEWLGIGKWGNKYSAPHVRAKEFGKALMTVVGERKDSPEALRIKQRAKECLDIVERFNGLKPGEKGPSGSEKAAEIIWEMVTNEKKKD